MLAPSSEVGGKESVINGCQRDRRVRTPAKGAGRALSSRLARLGAVSAGHGDEGRPCFSEDWAAGEHSSARTRGADMSRRKNGGQTFFLSFFFFFPQVEWYGRLSSNARRRQRRTGLRRACGCLRVRRGLPGVLLGGGAQIFRKTCCCPMSMCASERLINRLRNEVPGANLGLF